MIRIERDDTDAFVAWVSRVVNGVVAASPPAAVHLIQLDHWFDQKWLGFSGKALGAVGWWAKDLTVPPFHPHRVVSEHHHIQDELAGYRAAEAPSLHRNQSSSQNLQRRMSRVAPATACFWYTGDATAIGRGALMAYIPGVPEYSAWYVGLVRKEDAWRPATVSGIALAELKHIEEIMNARRAG